MTKNEEFSLVFLNYTSFKMAMLNLVFGEEFCMDWVYFISSKNGG